MQDKFAIIYASLSGNTEKMAQHIAKGIRQSGAEVDLKMVEDSSAIQLSEYTGFILGTYTWGDGELPYEFMDFCDEMDEINLNGSKTAIFGSGCHSYETYCGAVDVLENKLSECGAKLLQESLRVDNDPTAEDEVLCQQFGKCFAEAFIKVL
ncbi:flavodoxin [Paenibacillus crassostreae]|uniref:Flavodoxin n=1 Tax=Paenibacillus crassostreae TaxID=1763538 RepID=A0A167FG60_9BACL|nr:flavodoxin [Paenibacillus crassostreae]AOZ94437.1 flavodoxin [Paenibacillus crassostreae]OAB76526.1 flavodoxin [Paenibacillus crassostreae]